MIFDEFGGGAHPAFSQTRMATGRGSADQFSGSSWQWRATGPGPKPGPYSSRQPPPLCAILVRGQRSETTMRNPILAIAIVFVLAAPCTALAEGKKHIELNSFSFGTSSTARDPQSGLAPVNACTSRSQLQS